MISRVSIHIYSAMKKEIASFETIFRQKKLYALPLYGHKGLISEHSTYISYRNIDRKIGSRIGIVRTEIQYKIYNNV